MWFILRAKKTNIIKHFRSEVFLYLPFRHQFQEILFVNLPVTFLLLVRLQHLVSRRQHWLMFLFNASNFPQEIGKIASFGEAGKLRCVV